MIQHFLIDLSGDFYMTAMETDEPKESVESYWQQYSPDVRYIKTTEERSKYEKGERQCPLGAIVNCYCFGTKISTFETFDKVKYKLDTILEAEIDKRHKCVPTI